VLVLLLLNISEQGDEMILSDVLMDEANKIMGDVQGKSEVACTRVVLKT